MRIYAIGTNCLQREIKQKKMINELIRGNLNFYKHVFLVIQGTKYLQLQLPNCKIKYFGLLFLTLMLV